MTCDCPITTPGPSGATCGGSTLFLFMTILDEFIRTQCDIADPCGHFTSVDRPDPEYDFIIVGGGSAGSVVASRLTEVKEFKVLVVEAGGNEPPGAQVPSLRTNFEGSSIDWNYTTEPEEMACLNKKGRACYFPKGKVIGGTSVINGFAFIRGCKGDFDNWEKLGNAGWSFKDVLPYFLKSEDNLQADELDPGYHNKGGYQPVTQFKYNPPVATDILKAAEELGESVGDINGESCFRFMRHQTHTKNGIRYSAARAFLRPVKNRENLHIMLHSTATRVVVSPTKKKATGVEVITSGGKKVQIFAKKEVILSAGVVGSTQMLLLSGIGNETDLKRVDVPVIHNLPGVGKNLQNHIGYDVRFSVNNFTEVSDLNWKVAMEYLLLREGSMTGDIAYVGLITTPTVGRNDGIPDIKISTRGKSPNCSEAGLIGESNTEMINGKKLFWLRPVDLHTSRYGYIELRNNNPLSHPRIFTNYLKNITTVKIITDGIKFTLKLAQAKVLKKYNFELDTTPVKGCEEITFGSDEYWECAIRRNTVVESHHIGTCKMGPALDPMAVVDPKLKVHGLKSLRVIDASVMPEVVSANTYAATIMIGEKGADMVKQRWLRKYSRFESFPSPLGLFKPSLVAS